MDREVQQHLVLTLDKACQLVDHEESRAGVLAGEVVFNGGPQGTYVPYMFLKLYLLIFFNHHEYHTSHFLYCCVPFVGLTTILWSHCTILPLPPLIIQHEVVLDGATPLGVIGHG